MYIVFNLPNDNSYYTMLEAYRMAMSSWANQQNIHYVDKYIKYWYRVTFDRDEHYTIFRLTWNWPFEYELIDPKW